MRWILRWVWSKRTKTVIKTDRQADGQDEVDIWGERDETGNWFDLGFETSHI